MADLPPWVKTLIAEIVRDVVRAELQKHGIPVTPESRAPRVG